MNIAELIRQAADEGVYLSAHEGNLKFKLAVEAFPEPLKSTIIENKQAIIDFLESLNVNAYQAPKNLIQDNATEIKPEDLNLLALSEPEIQTIIERVPGGVANIEDIYPLNPLQEGILFHHMVSPDEDIYLSYFTFKINNEQLLDKIIKAFQSLVARHDTLRTIFVWEQLTEPVQVVLREGELDVSYVELKGQGGTDEAQQEIMQYRAGAISLQNAPLMKLTVGKAAGQQDYYVLVEHHHLITDHIGLDILVEELIASVDGVIEYLGQPTPYRNLVAYAREQNSDQKGIEYFKQKLAGIENSSLLFDIVPSTDTEIGKNRVSESIPASLCERIRGVAGAHKVNVATLFHTAWALVVSQCANNRDVVFGTVLSGRLNSYASSQRTMGLAINTLPLRVSLADMTVGQAIKQISADLKELIRYEQTPLPYVLEESSPHEILFNSIVNYRHSKVTLGQDQVFKGLDILDAEEQTNYPVTINVDDLQSNDFNVTVLCTSGADAERLYRYFVVALEKMTLSLASGAEEKLTSINVLTSDELQELLYGFSREYSDYPKEQCIHELFQQQAKENPDNVAVVFAGKQLSYRQLNERANQLAHYLTEHYTIKPDTLVGLCVERSLEMVIGIMGILKAGAAYVPLDPNYPQERLSYMCEDAGLEVVLSQSRVQEALAAFNGAILMLDGMGDTDGHFCSGYGKSNLNAREAGLSSSNLAYVIYTSGSTGKPKGVMVEHLSVINFLSGVQQNLVLGPDDNVLALTSINFDIHVLELYLTWSQGASLVLASEVQKRDPQLLSALMHEQEVSLAQATPSTWKMLIDVDWRTDRPMSVLCGGEALPVQVLSALQERLPNSRLFNMYGPTETTVWSSMALLADGNCHLGKPIMNTWLYLLDADQQLVPKGVVGELYIGGEGLTRGYLNRPQQTAERFIDNPFYDATQPNSCSRLYRTGDLVRYLPDGNLEFIGRTDDQVKIRGFRIELGEIEAQLTLLEAIDSAVVMVKELAGAPQIVAYVKAASQAGADDVFIKSIKEKNHENTNF